MRLPEGYEFVRELGSGGNGQVVCARQASLDRLVAVKSITDGACDLDAVARLRREGAVLAQLRHPNIVAVHDMLAVGEDLVLVMEFVDGPNLADFLSAGRPDEAAALAILGRVADGLEHAHARGVVHRDIKPGNILLAPGLEPRIADFGLARLAEAATAFRTDRGTASGTPRFMSPEHILDPEREVPAMDAYSFAVLAYLMLTGAYPFATDDSRELLAAHLTGAPRDPVAFNPRLAGPAAAALLAGLDKDPTTRLTPGPLVERLAAALGEPAVVPQPVPEAQPLPWVDTQVYRPRRPSRVNRVLPALVGGGLGLIVMLVIVLIVKR
jgi:serine/threonine-protein kinase